MVQTNQHRGARKHRNDIALIDTLLLNAILDHLYATDLCYTNAKLVYHSPLIF
jgi:hypothetical protein